MLFNWSSPFEDECSGVMGVSQKYKIQENTKKCNFFSGVSQKYKNTKNKKILFSGVMGVSQRHQHEARDQV